MKLHRLSHWSFMLYLNAVPPVGIDPFTVQAPHHLPIILVGGIDLIGLAYGVISEVRCIRLHRVDVFGRCSWVRPPTYEQHCENCSAAHSLRVPSHEEANEPNFYRYSPYWCKKFSLGSVSFGKPEWSLVEWIYCAIPHRRLSTRNIADEVDERPYFWNEKRSPWRAR